MRTLSVIILAVIGFCLGVAYQAYRISKNREAAVKALRDLPKDLVAGFRRPTPDEIVPDNPPEPEIRYSLDEAKTMQLSGLSWPKLQSVAKVLGLEEPLDETGGKTKAIQILKARQTELVAA